MVYKEDSVDIREGGLHSDSRKYGCNDSSTIEELWSLGKGGEIRKGLH